MAVAARYPGTCTSCGGRWSVGDLIRPVPDRRKHVTMWAHWVCPDDPADPSLRPGEKVCGTCFLVHPAGACDR